MTTLIPASDPQALPWALDALERGALVAIPTDTVYGLGADATQDRAVAAIFEAKGRPRFNPLIAHVFDAISAERLVRFDERARRVAARFWPGPLTIVLPRGPRVPDLVTAGGDTVGLRMPDHPFALALIEAAGGALAVTSANRSGEPSLRDPAAVAEALAGELELVVDSGLTPGGRASTVVALAPAGPTILREGPLDAATLRSAWHDLTAGQGATS